MRFDENARLDTSQIDDLRGAGGGGRGGGVGGRVAIGGGGLGVVGLILYFLLTQLGGGGGAGFDTGGLGGLPPGQTTDTSQAASNCRTGGQANAELDCEVVAVVNSLDAYWSDAFARSGITYQPPRTNFFSGGVSTGCGSASSAVGPFYCPADNEIYLDLGFFSELETRFGAEGGPFARAYVIAHEYGHHIQALLGTNERVRAGETGPTSGSVRLELQADCYAGVWANHAESVPTASGQPLIVGVTREDVAAALDTAARIGDDRLQRKSRGTVVPDSFTHGTSRQRMRWFREGLKTGDVSRASQLFDLDYEEL